MAWRETEHRDFRGGENLADNRKVLQPNEVVLMENALITGHGQAQKRPGMTLMLDSATHPGRIDHLSVFRRASGEIYYMVVSGREIRLFDGTVLRTGLSAGPYGQEVFADKWLLVDGTEYYESDGTAAGTKPVALPGDTDATLAEIKRCNLLLVKGNRVWAAGDPQLPHAVYYSQPNRYDYFKGGTTDPDMTVTIGQHDAQPILVMAEMFGGILVGKPTGWWLIEGDPGEPSTFRVQRLIAGQGPIQRAFAIAGSDVWYIADDGIRILREIESNVFTTILASHPHSPLLKAGDLSTAVMVYFDDRVLTFYRKEKGDTQNNFCSVADLRFQSLGKHAAWSRITGWNVSAAVVDRAVLWAGLEDGRLVRLFDGSTDLGTPITMRLWTPEYPLTETFQQKIFDGVNLEIAQTGFTPVRPTHEVAVSLQRQTNKWQEAFVSYPFETDEEWNAGTHNGTAASGGKLQQANPRSTVSRTEDDQADFQQGTLVRTKATADGLELDTSNLTTPTFTRPSVAYLSDGTQVASGVPRFEQAVFGQGLRVEEGTRNLLTANQSSVETDTSGFSAHGSGTAIARDTTEKWHGNASLKITTSDTTNFKGVRVTGISVTGGVTYTFSVYLKGSGQVRLGFDLQGDSPWEILGPIVALTNDWQRAMFTFTPSSSSSTAQIGIEQYNSPSPIVCYADGLQLEQKPHPTTWTLGSTTRTVETMYATLPQPLPQEFTAMGWFVPDWGHTIPEAFGGRAMTIFEVNKATPTLNDRIVFYYHPASDQFRFSIVVGGSVTFVAFDAAGGGILPGFNRGDPIAWAIRHDATGMVLSLKIGTTIKHYVRSGTVAFATDLVRAYVGCTGAAAGHESNGLHDDIVILSRALSDAEVEAWFNSGAPFTPDGDTLLHLPFDGNLSQGMGGYRLAPALDLTPVQVVGASQVSWETAEVREYEWQFLSSVNATFGASNGVTRGMKFKVDQSARLFRVGAYFGQAPDTVRVRLYRVSDKALLASTADLSVSVVGWNWFDVPDVELQPNMEYMLAFYIVSPTLILGIDNPTGKWLSTTVDGVTRQVWDRVFGINGDAFPTNEDMSSGLNFGVEYERVVPATPTGISTETSTDGGQTWQKQGTSGGPVPSLSVGQNVGGASLLVRQVLTTSDITVTVPRRIITSHTTSVSPQFPYTGEWISPEVDISPIGVYQDSTVDWTADEGLDGQVRVFTRYSLDGGQTWTNWAEEINGQPITGLVQGTDLRNARLQLRVLLTTNSEGNDPSVDVVATLFGFLGSVQRHFPLRPRLRGLYIQHRITDDSPESVTVLAVGERWRPTRHMRPSELEGSVAT